MAGRRAGTCAAVDRSTSVGVTGLSPEREIRLASLTVFQSVPGAGAEEPGETLGCVIRCLFTAGAQEDVSADQVATVVWNYFSQLGNNAKEAVEDLRKSDINHELK